MILCKKWRNFNMRYEETIKIEKEILDRVNGLLNIDELGIYTEEEKLLNPKTDDFIGLVSVDFENGNIIDLGKPFASGKYPVELFFYVDYAIVPYSEKSGFDSYPLAAIAPFDRMYVLWLKAQIQFANAEYGRYNNTISVFESEFAAYRNWYNRSHTPLNTSMTYF